MTPEEMAQLKAAAEVATPGPWIFDRGEHGADAGLKAIQAGGHALQHIAYPAGIGSYDDLAYLAFCSPKRILALLAQAQRDAEEVGRLRRDLAILRTECAAAEQRIRELEAKAQG